MEFGKHHAVGIHYMPAKFHDDRIRNVVSNSVFTHTRGVAVNRHFQKKQKKKQKTFECYREFEVLTHTPQNTEQNSIDSI